MSQSDYREIFVESLFFSLLLHHFDPPPFAFSWLLPITICLRHFTADTSFHAAATPPYACRFRFVAVLEVSADTPIRRRRFDFAIHAITSLAFLHYCRRFRHIFDTRCFRLSLSSLFSCYTFQDAVRGY